MTWKIPSAFAAGALIASGIVYVAVRPQPVAKAGTVAAIVAPPPTPQAPAPPASTPIPALATAAPPPEPVHEKPSPVRPPVHREKPVMAAQNREPAQPVPTPPTRAPINTERPYNDARPADPPPQQPAPEPQQPAPPPPPVAPAAQLPPAPDDTPRPVPAPAPDARVPHTVTIPAGTQLPVRVSETISAAHNQTGDTFLATLDQPLVVDGFVIAERGSRVEGRITEAQAVGRGKGGSRLGIELVQLSTADRQHIRIRTAPYNKEGASSTGSDVAKIGLGAAIGAAIGAAAGGGKGAGIGAGVGGAAGAADVALTRGKSIEIPVETRIVFRIQEPVTITERLE